MPAVFRTIRAEQDLWQIVDYIATDNLSAALAWLDQFEALFELLATQPEMGQVQQTNRFIQARRHAHGNYLIYYRPVAGSVEILRVRHAARDQNQLR